MNQSPYDSTELPMAEARMDEMALPYEAESWSVRHGGKDCDHRDFCTMQEALNWLAGCHGYGKTIFTRDAKGKRIAIWEDGAAL